LNGFFRLAVSFVGFTVLAVFRFIPFFSSFLPFFRFLLRLRWLAVEQFFPCVFHSLFRFTVFLPIFAVLTISQVVSASFGVFRWLVLLCFFTISAVCWFYAVFCCIFNLFTGIIYSFYDFNRFFGFFFVNYGFGRFTVFFVIYTISSVFRFIPFYFYDFNLFTGFSRIFDGLCQFSVFFRVIVTILTF
jgi:hypothetical protein